MYIQLNDNLYKTLVLDHSTCRYSEFKGTFKNSFKPPAKEGKKGIDKAIVNRSSKGFFIVSIFFDPPQPTNFH